MVQIDISGAKAVVRKQDVLTVGMVGETVVFRFDEAWDGLSKTAIFNQADVARDRFLAEDATTIPWEVLHVPGLPVLIGVYGTNGDGSVVIPTIWATTNPVKSGANPSGDESAAPPDPTVYQEILQAINSGKLKGEKGDTGAQGPQGEKGDTGATGAPGPQGPQGETGPKGDNGQAGEPGGYYTPAVTQPDANTMRLTFSKSKDGMPSVAETDITLPSGGSGSVTVDSTLTVSGQAADAKAVGDALAKKQDKPDIRTVLDDVAVAGAQYYLGEQTEVSIVLPDDADVGKIVLVSWYNGETAATLSITGTMLDFDFAPSANTRSEVNAMWDGAYWAVLWNEIAVPSEVIA